MRLLIKPLLLTLIKKYILGDYTKFSRKSLYKICDWTDITALITNKLADKKLTAHVEQYTQVITC